MKKNVALCFSGQIRDFDKCISSLNKYVLSKLTNFNVVKFGHCPEDLDVHKLKLMDFDNIHIEKEPLLDVSKYEKNKYLVSKPWVLKGNETQHYLRQLRSIYLSNELKKSYEVNNNIVFDWVFRLRYDNLYTKELDSLEELDNNYIYIPNHDDWGGYNDRFAFSSSSNMDIYCDIYNNIDLFYQDGKNTLHPETFLKWFLDFKKISVRRTNLTHNLLRYNQLWVQQ